MKRNAIGSMTHKTIVYPIFLPHAGCPFQCVYCNQQALTGSPSCAGSAAGIGTSFREQLRQLEEHARERRIPGELAFYGGTFTALPAGVIKHILEAATLRVRAGVFSGLRFSTRPDGMAENICSLLSHYPIETVELGVQSLDDAVLLQSRRGYSSERVKTAAALVRERGWRLGLQLMLGLPGDSPEIFLASIRKAVALRPDFLRIYPTVVLAGTQLAEWCRAGDYVPLSLEAAISWCVPAYELLFREQIPIARLGLHPDPELLKSGAILAGPYHPAFGYLVRVHWWRERLDQYFQAQPDLLEGREVTVYVGDRSLSEVLGPQRSNIRHWQGKWRFQGIRVEVRADQLPEEFEACLH
jgi:histone acetyltransferase (RNA polymerase elongator complex component)